MNAIVIALIYLLTGVGSADGQRALLPAYAHNDYRNERPLARALELGFRGVEVDYFVVDEELRVGHDPQDTRPGQTIESMYLAPLRNRFESDGEIIPGGETFILNIESKREGIETYEALHKLLARYEDILTIVRDGNVKQGPVQVILVGWFPSMDYMEKQPVRYAAVQCHYKNLPDDHERYPAHLLKLISLNYKRGLQSRGSGPVPSMLRKRLQRLASAAHAVPGRMARAFNVPTKSRAYSAILNAGVDLIGTKDIEGAARLLSQED